MPKTKEGASQRYQQYLQAVGRGDIPTMCEIAGPAMKSSEAQIGPCADAFRVMLQMFSTAQKTALRTATVDPSRVTVVNAAKVDIPTSAVKASITFSSDELGLQTMEYIGANWFITD